MQIFEKDKLVETYMYHFMEGWSEAESGGASGVELAFKNEKTAVVFLRTGEAAQICQAMKSKALELKARHSFPVLARACLWCLGAQMWRANLLRGVKIIPNPFNTAHSVFILAQASRCGTQ